MAGLLFGIGSRANKPKAAAAGLRIQSSNQGRPRAIGAGQNRLAGNIIWYGDYRAIPKNAPASSGGSGGKGGAGGTGKGAPTSYEYSASFLVSLGETISAVLSLSNGNEYDFFYTPSAQVIAELAAMGITPTYGNTYGASFFAGSYAQTPWSYLVSAHPDQALAYRGEAMAGFPNLGLGGSPTLPNFNAEVLWALNGNPAGGPDANAADWVSAFLTNQDWGAGFPSVLLGALAGYHSWIQATGMFVSPLLTDQTAAQAHLGDIMQGTLAEFVWRGGLLEVVPYADAAVSGNGASYTPPNPIYDLGFYDFLPAQGGEGDDESRVNIDRKDPADVLNQVKVEYLDRANLYNPVAISNQDDALIIAANRTKSSDLRTHHFFCNASAASISCAMQMRREKVLRTFYFALPPQFALLEPMDLVTLTEPNKGLNKQPVRIKEITEDDNGALAFVAEEYLGAVGTPLYERQTPLANGRNNNIDPGAVHDPIIFEPTDALGGGLQVWLAICGLDLSIWGGANIWLSSESGGTYAQVGQVIGNSRMGVTTADLPSIPKPPSGQAVDNINVLSVDLSESGSELTSGTNTDMSALDTACYVGGEVLAYQNATLTGANAYDLAPMVRGAFDTAIADHPAGTPFARLDDLLVKIPYTQDRVGKTIYLKVQSFNIYGGGLQSLADVGAFAYVVQGTALSSPLPDITNIRMTYLDNTSAITWDEVQDFRPIRYEIRYGEDWETGVSLGTVAHPPFTVFGDNDYLVKARSEPLSGLVVYSDNALSIPVVGSVIPDNLVATWDEGATGWGGTITGPGAIIGGNFVTTAANEIAYYEAPEGHIFDVLFDRPIHVNSALQIAGIPSGDDILTNPDFLGTADILASAATRFVDGWVEIIVQSGVAGDVYAAPDVYALPDVFSGSGPTAYWVKYAPGVVQGRFLRHRLALISYDAGTVAAATLFTNSADVPTRIDHFTNYPLSAAGETLIFTPDQLGVPTHFNAGPNGAAVPQIFVAILNAQPGDSYVVDPALLTVSQMFIRCFNSGVGVARTVNITAEGW